MNLATIVEGHPDDAVALVSAAGGTAPTTYGALRATVAALRGGLTGLGIVPGDRVAILFPNSPDFVIGYLAVLGAGGVAVPLNPTSPPAELERELRAVGAKVLLTGAGSEGAVAALDRAGLPALEHVVTALGTLAGDPVPIVDREATDLAVLMFTAGTAGAPKAAMLSHGNLLVNIEQVRAVPGRRLDPSDVCFGVLPLFHIFGLNVALGLTLASGASVVLVDRFDPAAALDIVQRHRCTVLAGAPPMWVAWAAMPDAPPDAFAGVRIATSGASRLAPETAAAMEERFGLRISEGYGLTEASPVVTSSVDDDAPPGSVGRPIPGVSVRLVDVDGEDALLGDSGELWVQGPNVFAGYWEDPAATATALADGWLRTGDVGIADEAGHLFLVDRSKDLVIVSGFNVYPAEVEEVLIDHPAVTAAAVVGVDHPLSGEAVKAYVVAAGQVTPEELIEFTASRLARYKCPTEVALVDDLPQGLGGKVLKRALR